MDKLNLGIEESLFIELTRIKPGHRYRCKLLGYYTGHSIMITPPRDGNDAPSLLDNDICKVSYMDGINACAFNTRIQRVCTEPFPYVHLYYPESIKTAPLRAEQRFPVKLKATIHAGEDATKIINVVDLSSHGIGFVAPKLVAIVGENIEIDIELSDSDSSNTILMKVELCNIQPCGPGNDQEGGEVLFRYGTKFKGADAEVQLKIAELIFQHINAIRPG